MDVFNAAASVQAGERASVCSGTMRWSAWILFDWSLDICSYEKYG